VGDMTLSINVGMGMNVQILEGDQFNRFKPTLAINELDPTGDIDAQIDVCLKAGEHVWTAISKWMEKKIEEELERPIDLPRRI